jgi:hypothetical protein
MWAAVLAPIQHRALRAGAASLVVAITTLQRFVPMFEKISRDESPRVWKEFQYIRNCNDVSFYLFCMCLNAIITRNKSLLGFKSTPLYLPIQFSVQSIIKVKLVINGPQYLHRILGNGQMHHTASPRSGRKWVHMKDPGSNP